MVGHHYNAVDAAHAARRQRHAIVSRMVVATPTRWARIMAWLNRDVGF